MKVTIRAFGKKMPDWVETAVEDYRKRFGRDLELSLQTFDSKLTLKQASSAHIQQKETEQLFAACDANDYIVLLDRRGKMQATADLANSLNKWADLARPIAILIGGAEGFTREALKQADQVLSLSPMTFPHTLVRIMLVEQLYRAYSFNHGHPYHRE